MCASCSEGGGAIGQSGRGRLREGPSLGEAGPEQATSEKAGLGEAGSG